jgi:hypothetical protein
MVWVRGRCASDASRRIDLLSSQLKSLQGLSGRKPVTNYKMLDSAKQDESSVLFVVLPTARQPWANTSAHCYRILLG